MGRIEYEKSTIEKMVRLYCKHSEGNKELCEECKALVEYAKHRLDNCCFGEHKSSCRQCKIHCYGKDMRKKMQVVMRFSGPRMLLYAPLDFFKHIYRELF